MTWTRRRVLQVTAALAGMAAAGGPVRAAQRHTWQGTALGAEASITLYHEDPGEAAAVVDRAVAEVRRLERVFSLYRPESALSRLNRDGTLAAPPLDLVRLMAEAHRISEATGGAFDVTVQPLWNVYARHFARPNADPAGPDDRELDRARALVDFRAVAVDSARIAFERPGMAVTANGIAQGYITDRVADLLRRAGLDRVMVNLGEQRALGPRPWRVGLEDPDRPGDTWRALDLEDRALATSGGYGLRLGGTCHHLFDPRTGTCPEIWKAVSVMASSATLADGLSTGFTALPRDDVARIVGAMPDVEAIMLANDGDAVLLPESRPWTGRDSA